MNLRGIARHLLAILAMGYAISGDPVAGIDPVYIVGAVGFALLIGMITYHAYVGYRTDSATDL